ncbi:class I SAM-dependent methyltransferase [Amycolatopsis minnesotensis]|uniref:Class I SAM-dependent methyltransferase n=1 Tax=Amycolatopsis minnesotensis TaxID=337894 RepID=A0ABP5BZ97_9PSEU
MSDGRAGADGYGGWVLTWYDLFVLGVVCPVVWRCPRREMLAAYDRNVGARHLDLGPGTGYFLARCRYPVDVPELALVDLNDSVLTRSARRVTRYSPTRFRRDVFEPLDLGERRFDSVGMNFLLHCLPGGMAAKGRVFDHVLPYLEPGGRIFGSTVLAEGVRHGPLAARALESLNSDGTMHNQDDSLDRLDKVLAARFGDYRLRTRGSVCFFEVTVA